jgi:RNA polymerase sigma-70 factor (ECF subfamily)
VDVVTAPAEYAPTAPTFESFFTTEYGRVVGLAFVLCGRQAVAEELAQDAFVQAYRRWSVISGYDDPGAWVRRVAVNLATSTLRRRAREARALARLAGRPTAPDELVVTNDGFWEAVRRLPRRQAQCVALRYVEDRSTAEIAAVLDIAEATVRGYLHEARAALAVALDVHLGEEEP